MARPFLALLFVTGLFPPYSAFAEQQQEFGSIIGQLRIARGDFPSHQIMIELEFRGAPVNSTYADGEGRFGFASLVGGEYHVIINDESYAPVDERLILNPETSVVAMAFITLRPRENAHARDPARARVAGSNPSAIDPDEYNKHFPKKAIKEYKKGLGADREGDRQKAISHYQAALQIAPDYYPAHNNLGSDYLSSSDFSNARKEFEQVIRLNQSDAAAYFNLSNVCMLMGQLDDAQRYLDKGMRREPGSALGHFLLGSLDLKTGKLQQAEAALRQTIQLSPTMAQARLQLVNLLLEEGRKADAASELHQFITTFPDSPFAPKARESLQKLETKTNASPAAK